MDLRQVLRTTNDGNLVLASSPASRIGLAAVGVALMLIMVTVGEISWFGVVLVVVSLAGAAAEDSWRFEPAAGEILHFRGLVFLKWTIRHRRDTIDRLRLRDLGSQLGRFQFVALELVTAGGEVVTIEMQKRRGAELAVSARRIADVMALDLDDETNP